MSCDVAKLVSSGRFFGRFFVVFCIRPSSHLHMEKVIFLPFESGWLLFRFLAWSLWQQLQCFAESGCPCLIADLRRKACSLSPLSMMLVVGVFINVHYQVKETSSILGSLDFFFNHAYFFCINYDARMIFFFSFSLLISQVTLFGYGLFEVSYF